MDRIFNDPFLSDKSHFDAPRLTIEPADAAVDGGGYHARFLAADTCGNDYCYGVSCSQHVYKLKNKRWACQVA